MILSAHLQTRGQDMKKAETHAKKEVHSDEGEERVKSSEALTERSQESTI